MRTAPKAKTPAFTLSFTPGKFAENVSRLIEFFGLGERLDIPVKSFAIDCDGIIETIEVIDGRPSSAFLLLYFSELASENYCEQPFGITDDMRQMTRDYFGPSLCQSAENDPDTRYTVIRALLTGQNVIVTLSLCQKY